MEVGGQGSEGTSLARAGFLCVSQNGGAEIEDERRLLKAGGKWPYGYSSSCN